MKVQTTITERIFEELRKSKVKMIHTEKAHYKPTIIQDLFMLQSTLIEIPASIYLKIQTHLTDLQSITKSIKGWTRINYISQTNKMFKLRIFLTKMTKLPEMRVYRGILKIL